MPTVYRNRIKAGTRLFSNVPDIWKEEVKKLLQKDVEDGEITVDEYNELLSR